jgi:hypothetical protein
VKATTARAKAPGKAAAAPRRAARAS